MATCNIKGKVIWLTGLSGSGKSTIAGILEKRLKDIGETTYLLDGDKLRNGINYDLGFTDADRRENIRRVAHVAALFYDAGIKTIAAVISPQEDMRKYARSLIPAGDFIEVYVKADLDDCIKRDPKGLYKKALAGQIPEFTGISSPYDEPVCPEIIIKTDEISADEAADIIIGKLL
jgi:adenylylsulfate kinase